MKSKTAPNTEQKKKADDSRSDRDTVVELMVDYWEQTGAILTSRGPVPFDGTSEEILKKIESVVDDRWCHHEGYGFQAEGLRKVLKRLGLEKKLEEAIDPRSQVGSVLRVLD